MPADEKLYRFDDVTVDCENFRVERGGRAITLTPRAFDVLVFLLRRGGRVVEKQELFEGVWQSSFVSDNALTKVVKELRRALADSTDAPRYIETVPKRGYRFAAEVSTGPAGLADEPRAESPPPAEPRAPAAVRGRRRRALRNYLLAGAGALMILALLFVAYTSLTSDARPAGPIDSVAVLPFDNAERRADLEYLSDGITENLINTLSRLPRLRVLPRTSVFYYKGKREDPHAVGRALRVRAVLTGKVVQRDDRLVVQAELVDVERKAQIWGQQYNLPLADVSDVQESIAREITDALRLQLTGAEQQRLARRYTENGEAYRLYLQGRFHWDKRTPQDLQKAVEYLERAVAADRNFALAFAGLADAYSQLANYGGARPRDAMPKAKDAVLTALSLDDRLSEAHNALGFILMCYDYDFAGAEREFRRAVELDPNYATAHQYYGNLLMYLGRHDEAAAEYERALGLEPLSLILNRMYGESLYYARRYDDAIAQHRKTLDLDANFASAHASLSAAHQMKGEFAAAVEEFARSQELIGRRQNAARARESFARGGWKEYLRAMADGRAELPLYSHAAVLAALGEKDEALALLNTAYDSREHYLIWIKVDPRLDTLRDDPRFRELLRRVGFLN